MLRAHKTRAANGYARAAFLHARAAEDLAERLEAIPRPFERALVVGGVEAFAEAVAARAELAARIGTIVTADVAPALLTRGGLAFELDQWPFAAGAFDLIVSPLALHWANDLTGALVQARMALKPDGLFLATMFGGETLMELRLALIAAESDIVGGASPRVAPFAELSDLAGLLQRAGFALPAADRDIVTVRYREPMRLFADLRAMGETSALAERPRFALSRRIVARALDIYARDNADPDGRVRARFDLMTLTGWAPHESQQKPLRPGSAKARLADALGVPERPAGEKAGG